MFRNTLKTFVLLLILVLLLSACQMEPPTPRPTSTPRPTLTPWPTATLTTSWDTLPQNGAEAFTRAFICEQAENIDCALDYYTQAIELEYDPISLAYGNRVEIYIELGQIEAAIADCETMLALPDFGSSHAYAAKTLVELRAMAAESTPVVSGGTSMVSQAAVLEGRACLEAQDYLCAVEKFNEAIELDPANADAYYNRALIQFMIQNYSGALADWSEALRLNPAHTDAYYARSYLYILIGDYLAALEDLNKLIELEPESAIAYSNRGNVYLDGLAMYDEAIADYTKAITLDPTYATAHYNLGNAYFRKGENEQAIRLYTVALSLEPANADAYVNRGLAHGNLGEYKEAVADFELALVLNPQDGVAYMGRGSAYEQLGETEKAIADFKRALALPDDPVNETHVRSQAALERLGED